MSDKDFQMIFDCLGRLLKVADRDQSTATELLKKLDFQVREYELNQQRCQKAIEQTIYSTINTSIQNEVNQISASFNDAQKQADAAAKRYEKSSNWAIWKVAVTGVLIAIITLSVFVAAVYMVVPSYEEITARISKMNELDSAIRDLESRGALAKTSYCGQESRFCVRVDGKLDFYGDEKEKYMIIHGY
ncbi:hypothetical protein [Pleionea sp. CnH1-48]|uniref:hypothetical protein n=1 Tax=Pleionea sp. CnH1-48 TaxID=2954494 RepID=UPI0020986144|nr:hypothetical protein [Pleionea sp. CnH1-48]MCO7226637.1 hypothetical protein [Pleionea sp. CnH1-48]